MPLSLHPRERFCTSDFRGKPFSLEIIDYLHETSLPLLREKLEKKMERGRARLQTPAAPRRAFLFRDIFYCDRDSEDDDDGSGPS